MDTTVTHSSRAARLYGLGSGRVYSPAWAPLGANLEEYVATIELRAEPRSVLGKKVRFLRRDGMVPANVYGHAESTAIQVPVRAAEQAIQRAGRTHLIALTV